MRREFKNIPKMTALVMIPVITASMFSFTGCGSSEADLAYEDTEDYEEYEVEEGFEEYDYETVVDTLAEEAEELQESDYDEDYSEAEILTVEKMLTRPVTYSIENKITTSEKLDNAPITVTLKNYCDSSAIEYAKEHNCEEYLMWLCDYAVNVIEPQAVEKLLQIPVFAEAARNGEISRYISIYITFNDVAGFGAMEKSCYMGRDGHGLEDWDSPFYSLGHKVLVNLNSFHPESIEEPDTMRFFESAMIHEMMHAFVTDYLFNLSLGTGRDGARVMERDSNGKLIYEDEDNERPILVDEIPMWLQEGFAMLVENPYGTRRDALNELIDGGADGEEYLELLSDPEMLSWCINVAFEGEEGISHLAKITDDENTYSTGWVASLFLCAMAGEKLGYEVFDKNGYLNTEAVFYGLNEILSCIHEGQSLDYFIADVSFDYDLGKSTYKDTTEFEEKCFSDPDDPGLKFMQKLLYDLEARAQVDPDNYLPTGSVIADCGNAKAHLFDTSYHSQAIVYEVDNIDANDTDADYFSITTIPLSRVALTGGRRTSYDPYMDPLTAEEEAERDYRYIGAQKKYIDFSLEDD